MELKEDICLAQNKYKYYSTKPITIMKKISLCKKETKLTVTRIVTQDVITSSSLKIFDNLTRLHLKIHMPGKGQNKSRTDLQTPSIV